MMATQGVESDESAEKPGIKVEIDAMCVEDQTIDLQIKIEHDDSQETVSCLAQNENVTLNPFEHVHLEIKQELGTQCRDNESDQTNETQAYTDNTDSVKSVQINSEDSSIYGNYTTMPDSQFKVDVEMATEGDSLVTYDYPDFTDAGSMDSSEATALGHVETCFQENVDIKSETDVSYNVNKHISDEDLGKIDMKIEPDLTVTETHLITNKLIKTTSTVTNPQGGLIQSRTTKTLVMEILPMPGSGKYCRINSNPETILPTSLSDDYNKLDYDNNFHLNSITGDVLSLEQEAYGVLKTKQTKMASYNCPKCVKVCNSKKSFNTHLKVHDSIERRLQGQLRGMKTRIENKSKRMKAEKEQHERNTKTVLKQDASAKSDKRIEGRLQRLKRRIENKSKRLKTEKDQHKQNTIGVLKQEVLAKGQVYVEKRKRLRGLKTKIENKSKRVKSKKDECERDVKAVLRQESPAKKEGYECTCGKVFRRRSRMETCLRSHELFSVTTDCYSCISCGKQFRNKVELALHRKRLHSRKKFLCKFCPTDYDSRKELFKHLQIHQKVQEMEYKVLNEVMNGKQKLKCFMCMKTYSELSDLKNHVMEDHREPYVCPHCKKTFTKIIDFGNHTKACHPEVEGQSVLDVLEAFSKLVKAWKCEECELQFHEADKLALHQVVRHHPDIKPENQFQCTDCRRVYMTKQGLKSHRRIHHSVESTDESEILNKGIMCLECRKICNDMKALTSHMRLHSPDRKYPCKFCDFRFATPEKRKAHAEIHTGDMKYVCFICEYQCSSENRLKQHKTSVKHLNMKEYLLTGKPLIEETTSSNQKTIHDGSKSSESSSKKRTKEHRDSDSSSSENNDATCEICGDTFSDVKVMLEHKETHPFIEIPSDGTTTRIFFK